MVDKAKIQAYIATLPPKERAKFQKLPEKQQISIMNKALGTMSVKSKGKSSGLTVPRFSQQAMNSVFGNGYTCPSDNTRVNYSHVEFARKEVEVKQEIKKAGKEPVKKLNLKPVSAQSQKLRAGIVNRMSRSYNAALGSFNTQMQKDGWAGDVADGISKLWNNNLWNATGNTADMVRDDLKKYKGQIAELRASVSLPDFPAKFKQVYGINYNEQNIKAFYATEHKVQKVATAVTTAKAVQSAFELPLKQYNENYGLYKDHVEVLHGPTGTIEKKVPKETLLKNMRYKVEEMVGGQKGINQIAKQSNIDFSKLSDADKYKFYGKIAQQLVESSKNAESKALNGKNFEYYEKQYDASYSRAFGNKNNIQKRIAKYNTSQEIGTAAVKSGAQAVVVVGSTVAIVASGGTASPLVIAGITGASSAAIDISDKATNGIKGDVKKSLPETLKSATIDAGFAYVSGNVAKGITKLVKPTSTVGTAAVKAAANGIGSATEGSVKDVVTGGVNNLSIKTFAVRALIASTLGNIKMVTDNDALIKTINVGKSATMSATVKSVKIDIKEQAKAEGATEAQKVVQFMESNPEEFEKIVMEVAKEQEDVETPTDNKKVGQVIEQKTNNLQKMVVDIPKELKEEEMK